MTLKRKQPEDMAGGNLTLDQRHRLCEHLDAHPEMTQTDLALWAQVEFALDRVPTQSSISSVLRNRNKPQSTSSMEAQKKTHTVSTPALDAAIARWLTQCFAEQTLLTFERIQQEAQRIVTEELQLAEPPTLTTNWVQTLLKRHHWKEIDVAVGTQAEDAVMPRPRMFRLVVREKPAARLATNASKSSTATAQPLVYLSTKSIGTVQAPGMLNWEVQRGNGHDDRFVIVEDGLCVLQPGVYQVNVDIEHSQPRASYAHVFTLWQGPSQRLAQCSSPLQCKKEVATSVLQWRGRLPRRALLRVEFLAPGFAFHQSRLVIRLVPPGT